MRDQQAHAFFERLCAAVSVLSHSFLGNLPGTFGTVKLTIAGSWRVVAYAIVLAFLSVMVLGLGLVAILATLFLIATLATLVPASHALSISPMQVLRHE